MQFEYNNRAYIIQLIMFSFPLNKGFFFVLFFGEAENVFLLKIS